MDLDAEMLRLEAEARRLLEAREEEERELLAAEAERAAAAEKAEQEAKKADKKAAKKAQKAAKKAKAAGLDLDIPGLPSLGQAAALARGVEQAKEAAEVASKWTLLQKFGMGVVGLVVFVVCWKLFLRTVVEGVLAVALLILILVAIGKLLGWTRRKKDED